MIVSLDDRQHAHARWLKAAAIYNVVWGTANVLWPKQALRLLGVPEFVPASAWRTVGMMVAGYAPAYWWAAQDPHRRAHIVAIGLLGHVLGPLGFVWALKRKRLPL